MSQPPQGPWRPGPYGPPPLPVAPPPQARPLPPRPGYRPPPPGYRPPPPGYRPPPPGYQQQPGFPPQRPGGQPTSPGFPYAGPPPPPPPRPMGSTAPPWTLPYGGPPRRKSNTGAILATVLVGVLVVGAGVIGVVAFTGKKDHVADTGYDYSETTSSSTTSEDTETTTTTTTTERTTRSTTTTTTRTTRTSTTPRGPQPVYTLGDNPLFTMENGTSAVTCSLSRWQTNPQAAAEFFTSALPCMEEAWAPAMQRANLPYFRPKLEFPEGTNWSSPCGSVTAGAVAAFYCGQNATIYMPFAGLQAEQHGAHPGVYLALFAHEFGHHVQAMSGVWEAYWEERYDAGADTDVGLELSRRSELQAQCFSGMFLAATYPRGSVDDNILTEARTTQNRGDHTAGAPRDHGTDEHATAWWEQGAQKNRTGQCNTWLANSADVA